MSFKRLLWITTFALMVSTLIISCKKEIIEPNIPQTEQVAIKTHNERVEEVYDILQESGIEELQRINKETIEETIPVEGVARNETCYDSEDLLILLSEFGDEERDVIPFVPNIEFQDGNCFVARWDADLAERDPIDSTTISTDLQPINVTWTLDQDPPVSTGESLTLPFYTYKILCDKSGTNCDTIVNVDCPGIFQPSCNGVHEVTIKMEFASGLIVERSGTGRAVVNLVPSEFPLCEGVEFDPSQLGTFDFTTFTPIKFEPYEFVIQSSLQSDFNGDFVVSIADLIILLAGYGSC